LNKEGYQSWSISVYVTSGDTETVSASMSAMPIEATPTIIPVVSPTLISTPAFTPTPTPISALIDSDGDGVPDKYDYDPYDPNVQTKSDIETPGFEVVFAIAGLLAITFLLRRRR
jgi:PGF-CTERM protein